MPESSHLPIAQREIGALTGMRALASWWVVLFHMTPEFEQLLPGWPGLRAVAATGPLGVDVFFVLSGFVLAYTYQTSGDLLQPRGYLEFLKRRIARLYPVHLATILMWGAFIGLNALFRYKNFDDLQTRFHTTALVKHLLLIHGWNTPIQLTWNIPAWSISMEWFAYLLFPAILIGSKRIAPVWMTVTGGFLLLAAVGPTRQTWPDVQHYCRILFEFTAGTLLCQAYLRLARKPNPLWSAVSGVTTLLVYCFSGSLAWTVYPLMGAMLLALAVDRGPLPALLSSRPLLYLGRISYSLYMSHAAAIIAGHFLLPHKRYVAEALSLRISVVACYFAMVLVAAILLYHLIEVPAQKWIRRIPIAT